MKRVTELDSLRGIAAIAVLIYHYTSRFGDKFNIDIIASHFRFDYGKHGVELFFTISGFVIFMSIEKVKTPFEFVYKRFMRLYPTFWICMITTFLIITTLGPDILKVSGEDFIKNLTMLPDFLNAKNVDGAYWTLKVEMLFYGIIFLLLVLNWKSKIKSLGYGYLFIGIIFFTIKQGNWISSTSIIFDYYSWGLLFLSGINFYHIKMKGGELWNHLQINISLLFTLVGGVEMVLSVLIVTIIFYLFSYGKLAFLSVSPLIFLGRISYPLYLVHQNISYTIMLKMISFGISNHVALILIPFVFCILLAASITYWMEKPVVLGLSRLYALKYKE
jgi:peptidoglycan/LPS O-acetylase OafA/YrhL